ncbi:SEN2 subunit of the tRNA splicing endonuclease-like protein [Dipodascopsis tothii]|uniref:SEN2 subunit of the tRNA splicing endonuclease-like protein n=1 Tax=Dipodascopsis tothii TaxID=44089 RepID=UPI0034CFA03F
MNMRRQQLNAIYADPLPVVTRPLPPLVPHNVLSLAQYAYCVVAALWQRVDQPRVAARLDGTTVTVEAEADMIRLWRSGFFGKGTQSRSEPTWQFRTERRLDVAAAEAAAPEDVTAQRRRDRRQFKSARAAAELEELARRGANVQAQVADDDTPAAARPEDALLVGADGRVERREALQLSPQEAFFLAFGLGVLDVRADGALVSTEALLQTFSTGAPDDRFVLHYVVYHHYRSLGWCVREGVKFGVDMLLYKRGPPFSHAEYAIMVVPVYADESKNREAAPEWWWASGLNRVIGGVKKTLVLCHVEIPTAVPSAPADLLAAYRLQEVVVRRWVPGRNRD